MWRFSLLLLAMLGWTAFAGCGGPSKPEPLTVEQERELQEQMKQVEEQERARATRQAPGSGGR